MFLWVSVLCLSVASFLGGQAYVWCEPMQRAMLRPCCPQEGGGQHRHADEGRPEDRVDAPPCCQVRRIEPGAPSTPFPHAVPPAVPAGWVALLPLPGDRTPERAPAVVRKVRGRAHPARAGPRVALHALHCVYLC